MAPKQKSLKAAFRKEPPTAQATPDSKSPKTADETPEGPKRRKLDEDGRHERLGKAEERPEKAAPHVQVSPADGTGPLSLWTGSSGDKKALSSPAFDPALRSSEFPTGKAVGFALLSDALTEIEDLKNSGKGSRKSMTVILSNLFRILLYTRPEDLVPTIYILCNKVAPDYEESELGIGDSTLFRAMGDVFGRSEKHMKESIVAGDAKDLGEVALLSRLSQKMLMMPPKLTLEKVFAEMKAIANASGKDSQKTKKEKVQKMLVASRGAEAKYIVRMCQAKLRVGIQTPTMLQAIAYAFTLTTPAVQGGKPVGDVRNEKGKLSLAALEQRMVALEAAVKQAYCELPNFDRLIAALREGRDGSNLAEACHITMGVPVKPMLAKPSKGISEVTERLTGKRFTGEWKYDGERAQIHVVSRDKILVYSRNSENMTEKYPDVIKVVQDTLCEGVESCIIDSELVAYDQTNNKILPFQVLTTRGRKNIDIDSIKVHVCIYAFDCILHNGKPLVRESLEKRREHLYGLLKETPGKVVYATHRNFDELNEEKIQEFLDESVAGSCEGLMLKTLVDNATYEPSKRSLNWLKLKKDYMDGMADSIDVVPIGAFYGKGKRTGAYGAFLLAVYDPEAEEFQTVCKAGTGFSDEDLSTHYTFFKDHVIQRAEANYNVTEKVAPDVWLEACQVWEIRAADLSISPVHTSALGVKADGKGIGLRFPRFIRIRDDKSPEDATSADQIVEMFEAQASVEKGGGGGDDDW